MQQKISKQAQTSLLVLGAVILAAGTFVGAFKLGPLLSKKSEVGMVTCKSTGQNHTVTIQNDTVSPSHTNATACDTLTIINDDGTRLLAFGQHDRHVAYDGVREREVAQGQNLTVTLNQKGNFLFHDHDQEDVSGTFTVK